MARALIAVLELHCRRATMSPDYGLCNECQREWPCETYQAITTELAKEDQK
jgi:hypothetical protein